MCPPARSRIPFQQRYPWRRTQAKGMNESLWVWDVQTLVTQQEGVILSRGGRCPACSICSYLVEKKPGHYSACLPSDLPREGLPVDAESKVTGTILLPGLSAPELTVQKLPFT